MTDHARELIGELRRTAESRRQSGENNISGLLRNASDALAWYVERLARAARVAETPAGGALRAQAGGASGSAATGIGATLAALGLSVRSGEFALQGGPTIRLCVGDQSIDMDARQAAALRLAITNAQHGSYLPT